MRRLCPFVALFWLGSALAGTAQDLPVVKDSTGRKNRLLIFPIVSRAPETSWDFGFASAIVFRTSKYDTLVRTSTIPFGAVYTLNRQFVAVVSGSIFFPGEKYILRLENSFSSFPDRYWGRGNFAPDVSEERYDFKQFYLNPALVRNVYRKLFVGLSYEFQRVFDFNYTPGGLFDREGIVGRRGGQISGLGLVLSRDSRNGAYAPDNGSLIQLTYTRYMRGLGSDFNYHVYELDARKFIRIKRFKGHVLAMQTFGWFAGGEVPFRNLGALGSPTIMRGYYGGRYRDNNYLAVQAEYRAPVWWRFGLVGFLGFGRVGENFDQLFQFGGYKYSLGGGLRFALLPKEKLNVRLDYGFGNDNNRSFYVVVSEAF